MSEQTKVIEYPEDIRVSIDALKQSAGGGPEAQAQGQVNADPVNNVTWPQVLEQLLGPTFEIVAPNWKVDDDEVKLLAGVYGDVMQKYFPDDLNKFGVELTALMVTFVIFKPRMDLPRKVEEKDVTPKKEKANES